jgi:UPF0755 protein
MHDADQLQTIQPLDPNKYHVFNQTRKRVGFLLMLLTLFVLLPIFLYGYYKIAVKRPSPLDKEIMFEIKSGQGISEISTNLQSVNAINSKFMFMLYLYLNRMDKGIQAGIYQINAGETVVDLAERFQHGVNDVKITFLEGWRVEEFARKAASALTKIDYNNFVSLAKKYEGYLAPDTYEFNKDVTEEDVIAKLTKTFDRNYNGLITPEKLSRLGLSKEQVIIFASIVEREVFSAEDRQIVAGILMRRFKEKMKIDADATTQYAVASGRLCPNAASLELCAPTFEDILKFNFWPNELTMTDLENSSPYNTRKNVGLPPTPISSFSMDALKSVLDYKESPYYFYLTDLRGITHYAKDLDEHNANVAQFLSQ